MFALSFNKVNMTTLALIFNMLLFVYHQWVLNFDLFPFNDIEGVPFQTRLVYSLVSGASYLFALLALRLDRPQLVAIASVLLAIILFKELYPIKKLFISKYVNLQRMFLLALQLLALFFTILCSVFNPSQAL